MATKPKAAPKKKAPAKKAPAKKSTPAKKTKAPARPATKPKSPARPRSTAKAAKPRPVAKPVPKPAGEHRISESGMAFEKKIDEISTSIRKPERKTNNTPKIALAAAIIIILAAIVYFLYPGKRTPVVDEQLKPGEQAGPAPEVKVEEQKAEPAPEISRPEDSNIYKVKYKDQLTTISKEVYGDHKEWKRIYEANKDKISNPNLIFPGQELIIPR